LAAAAVWGGGLSLPTPPRRADLTAVVGGVATLPVAVVGLALLVPIFGEEYADGRTALLILFLAAGVTTASAPYRVLYTALASDRRVAIATAIAAAGNVLANLAVIGRFGMEGAATTTLLSQIGMLLFLVTWSGSARKSEHVPGSHPRSSSSAVR
jgi:O-antigen/teichoic acid export membrane protein